MLLRKGKKEPLRLYPSDFVEKVPTSLSQEDIPHLDKESLSLFRKILGERHKAPRLVPID
ncbi:hypothetical protein FRC07_002925 [Ceratobasidium sp. 392]|nr:hypothetical protein FRC07_002925 [Ceratobasidium sp. 392]